MPIHFYNHDISTLKNLVENMTQIFESANQMEEHDVDERISFYSELSDMFQDLSEFYEGKVDGFQEILDEEEN